MGKSSEGAAQTEPDEVSLRGSQVSLATIQETRETFQTVEVVKILTPSVVQIVTEFLAMDTLNQPVPGRGVGTGVILDQQGHILTNNHVIDGAQRITVTLSSGKSLPAQVVGGDATTDTAVIRVEAPGLQPAVLGLSLQSPRTVYQSITCTTYLIAVAADKHACCPARSEAVPQAGPSLRSKPLRLAGGAKLRVGLVPVDLWERRLH